MLYVSHHVPNILKPNKSILEDVQIRSVQKQLLEIYLAQLFNL